MAFQFSNEGVPYHQPVAPVVPTPDNTAAKLIGQGGEAGVMGFVHMAIAAQQAKVEQQQMLQKADLAAQELQHRDQWQQQDYEVAKQNADTNAQYRKDWYDIYKENADTEKDSKSALLKEKIRQKMAGDDFMANYATTQTQTENSALQAATKLKLNDERYRNNYPVEWLAAKDDFERRFGTAKVGAIPGMINTLNTQAKSMTVPFVQGAEYTDLDEKGNHTGQYSWSGMTPSGGKQMSPVPVPLTQIVSMWQDPTQRQYVEKGLIAAGHGHVVAQVQKAGIGIDIPWTGRRIGTKDQISNVPTLDAYGSNLLNSAGKVKPSEARNEVDPILQQSRPPQWMIKAGVGEDANQSSANTAPAVSSIYDQAAAALQHGIDPDWVRKTLIDNGGDPAQVPGL